MYAERLSRCPGRGRGGNLNELLFSRKESKSSSWCAFQVPDSPTPCAGCERTDTTDCDAFSLPCYLLLSLHRADGTQMSKLSISPRSMYAGKTYRSGNASKRLMEEERELESSEKDRGTS